MTSNYKPFRMVPDFQWPWERKHTLLGMSVVLEEKTLSNKTSKRQPEVWVVVSSSQSRTPISRGSLRWHLLHLAKSAVCAEGMSVVVGHVGRCPIDD